METGEENSISVRKPFWKGHGRFTLRWILMKEIVMFMLDTTGWPIKWNICWLLCY